jgi:hypothetical protein
VPPDDVRRQAKLLADQPDLVLEQRTQRLDQRELQVVGKATHVVVALDVGGSLAAAGLDDVRGTASPDEEADLAAELLDDLPLGLLEHADELASDDLALGLGITDAGERVEELLGGIDHPEVDAGGGDVVAFDLLGLPLAQ